MFVVEGFSDVVEQADAACDGVIEVEFCGHQTHESGDFDAVLEDILGVAGAVFESAEGLDEGGG